MIAYRCSACLGVLTDRDARRCGQCGQRFGRRRRPVALGAVVGQRLAREATRARAAARRRVRRPRGHPGEPAGAPVPPGPWPEPSPAPVLAVPDAPPGAATDPSRSAGPTRAGWAEPGSGRRPGRSRPRRCRSWVVPSRS
ncbi:MAG: hypothetical protein KatS3mg009_1067 [Acidimicrobiia bacterium]|nr:MAG: hypothetical protein KatS3mg009_1067 [Acidimicrobiia bacterium]